MNCQEFDRCWDELLDAETAMRHLEQGAADLASSDPSPREQDVRSHALNCPRCHRAQLSNEALRRAIRSWNGRRLAAPPADLVDRIIDRTLLSPPPLQSARRVTPHAAWAVAAAAGLVLAIGSVRWAIERRPVGEAAPGHAKAPGDGAGVQTARARDVQLLSHALADATEATWDLARSTSGPAARLGRQVLEVATRPGAPPGESLTTDDRDIEPGSVLAGIPSVLRDLPDSPPGAGWLRDMEDGLAASVRPLSTTAWEAFGFLRTPSLGKGAKAAAPPASKGA
jgi:hypothetical protein